MSHFTFIYADRLEEMNCSLYNILYPAKYINEKYPGVHSADTFSIEDFQRNSAEIQESCSKADLIIIERNLFGNALVIEMLYWAQDKNIAVIFDDDYTRICEDNMAYPLWHHSIISAQVEGDAVRYLIERPHKLTQLRRGVRIAKGLICPSRVLADDWKEYTNTYRIHNYLDLNRYPPESQPLFPHEGIIIGWCGSSSHVSSFMNSGVLPALISVCKKYPNVKLLLGGDKRVYDAIDLPEDKKSFTPSVPDERWFSLLKSIDIGIAPLASEFDRRRSWIKALEYMIAKVPWIATRFETYDELGEYGVLVDNGSENWECALCDMVENIEKYRERANGISYDFALSQTYENQIDELLKVYLEIINSKDRDEPPYETIHA